MKNAADMSIEELEQLLDKKKKDKNKAPAPLDTPNFNGISDLVTGYIKDIGNDLEPKDIEHWCYEACVEAIYGRNIWNWINNRNR